MALQYITNNPIEFRIMRKELALYGIEVEQFKYRFPEEESADIALIASKKAKIAYDISDVKHQGIVLLEHALDIGNSQDAVLERITGKLFDSMPFDDLLTLLKSNGNHMYYYECLAYLDDHLIEPKIYETSLIGRLAPSLKFNPEYNRWPVMGEIFIPAYYDCTVDKMTEEQYAKWRNEFLEGASTVRDLADWLKTNRRISVNG